MSQDLIPCMYMLERLCPHGPLVTFYNSKLVPVKNVPNNIAIYYGTRFHVFRGKHAYSLSAGTRYFLLINLPV